MKKSRSSTPRLEARCPGLFGMAGAREDCEGDPRVEIAVGKTLDYFVSCIFRIWPVPYNEGSELPANLCNI